MPGLVAAVYAFDNARQRVEETGVDVDATFVPLTEACWWAISVHEGLEKRGGNEYAAGAKDADGGRVVLGLKYIRNILGHERVVGVEVGHREHYLPLNNATARVPELHWLAVIALPVPDRDQPTNEMRYADWVAGREVTGTLLLAASWLFNACGVLGYRLHESGQH